MNIPEKSMYCLWNHLESFHRQAMDRKIADFGEPCSDCKYWLDCGGDWYMRTKLPPKENGDFIQEICIFLLINPRIACII